VSEFNTHFIHHKQTHLYNVEELLVGFLMESSRVDSKNAFSNHERLLGNKYDEEGDAVENYKGCVMVSIVKR